MDTFEPLSTHLIRTHISQYHGVMYENTHLYEGVFSHMRAILEANGLPHAIPFLFHINDQCCLLCYEVQYSFPAPYYHNGLLVYQDVLLGKSYVPVGFYSCPLSDLCST